MKRNEKSEEKTAAPPKEAAPENVRGRPGRRSTEAEKLGLATEVAA